LPPSSKCTLEEARWKVCWVNLEALIIAVSVIGGLVILSIIIICCYCWCCRGGKGRKQKRFEMEDAKFETQKMERRQKQDERRSERRNRLDDIRRKYGLLKDEPYQRFANA